MAGGPRPDHPDVAPVRGHQRRSASVATGALPTLRDPDLLVYYREDGEGLVMGGYERARPAVFCPTASVVSIGSRPTSTDACCEDDWDRFEEIAENSKRRVPAMDESHGYEADQRARRRSRPTTSSASARPRSPGFFVAAGFCAHGLAGAGGIGKVMAEWIAEGEPERRPVGDGHPPLRAPSTARRRTRTRGSRRPTRPITTSATPNHEREPGTAAARVAGLRLASPSTRRSFGEKSGWERVNWYESQRGAGDESLRPRGWAGQHWSPAIGVEHEATRESVAIFDETSFAKMEIEGAGGG